MTEISNTKKVLQLSENDMKTLQQLQSMVTKKLAELGSQTRQLDFLKREAERLIEQQSLHVSAANEEVTKAENVFQSFMTVLAEKYNAGSEKPQINLGTGEIYFG